MSNWKTNRKTKKVFKSEIQEALERAGLGKNYNPTIPILEAQIEREKARGELHPFVARPSTFEPILTTSQKLTPAQKEHLDEFQDHESLITHLAGFHGQTFPTGMASESRHPIDPQVAERFGLKDRPVTDLETLKLRHLQEHLDNIEERVRTAPKRKPLTEGEYREAGVDEAPGFEK